MGMLFSLRIKSPSLAWFTATLLALLVAGCETVGGIDARTQEKSAVYATLKPWQKKYITQGVVVPGFTPDMVYMAVGSPSRVEPMKNSDGSVAEVWIYNRYYPTADAAHARYTPYKADSPFLPSTTQATTSDNGSGNIGRSGQGPAGVSQAQSIGATGAPQGGSLEPPDLRAYTLQVLLQDGQVAGVGIKPN
jgi:hypothetical protein